MDSDKGYSFVGYVIVFGGVLLVLVFAVAFIHDLFTGQLDNTGDRCEQYTSQEAFEACADAIING
jgi:hypothetical protein